MPKHYRKQRGFALPVLVLTILVLFSILIAFVYLHKKDKNSQVNKSSISSQTTSQSQSPNNNLGIKVIGQDIVNNKVMVATFDSQQNKVSDTNIIITEPQGVFYMSPDKKKILVLSRDQSGLTTFFVYEIPPSNKQQLP